MNKKLMIFGIVFLTFFGLISCANQQDVFAEAYPENDNYYQVFVRSFADSDGDGIGDFNGITDKLDYFVDLGISGLWLMPIHPSPTYHGYDVTDYYDVNEDYGTMDDFENLISAAEDKGIKIMLDMVFNHTSNQHPWFLAALNGDETYKEYYNFIDNTIDTSSIQGSWGQSIWHKTDVGQYCGYFFYTMPDLNLKNEVVKDEIVNISKFWIDKGVQGFRLDAALHFFGENEFYGENTYDFENVLFLKDYMDEIDDYKENIFVTAEAFEEQLYQVLADFYIAGVSPLGFPEAAQIRTAAQNTSNRRYVTALEDIYDSYRDKDSDFIGSPFVVNHDMERYASQVLGNMEAMKLAAEMLLVLPGNPIIYYGEEIGMYGYKASGPDFWDETRRLPIMWGDDYTTDWITSSHQNFISINAQNAEIDNVAEQLEDPTSLLNVYKTMLHLRNENIALKYGNSFVKWDESTSSLQGFYREVSYDKYHQKLLILHNFDNESIDMIEFVGTLLYVSGLDDLTDVTTIPAKSTVIIDITEE